MAGEFSEMPVVKAAEAEAGANSARRRRTWR
jgi:hypothetical protein